MKVFISWSGDTSKAVATALYEWLPEVIQNIEPFFSSQSIKKGARGLNDIAIELEESNFGVLCLTKDNPASPWINFEAGALSKTLAEGKVAPFLFNMAISDITGHSPLGQFQATFSEKKQDVLALLQSINNANETKLTEERLKSAFEKWWPALEEKLSKIPVHAKPVAEIKKPDTEARIFEILDQLLGLARQQASILKSSSNLLPYLQEITEALRPDHSIGNLQSRSGWGNSWGSSIGSGDFTSSARSMLVDALSGGSIGASEIAGSIARGVTTVVTAPSIGLTQEAANTPGILTITNTKNVG